MKRLFFPAIAVIALVIALSGCGKVPQTEIDTAKAAVEAARVAQADVYLPVDYAHLQDSLNVCLSAVETQKSKFFRSFSDVKAGLESVATLAAAVKDNAAIKKEEVRVQTGSLLTEVNNMIAETKALILKAPRGKEGAAALNQIKNEITVIEASVSEAAGVFASEQYMAASNKLKAVKENVEKINAELKAAIAKVVKR